MRVCWLLLLVGAVLTAQQDPRPPTVSVFGVRNGASMAFSFGPVRQGPAPGSIFLVQGAWLGPDEIVVSSAPYPATLAESQVEIRPIAGGEVFLVPLIHAWSFQLAGILPTEFPVGPAELTVVYQGRRSEAVELEVSESWPGLFSVGQTGVGPTVAQNWESAESAPLNLFTRPARPGQTIVLWGTGFNNADGARDVTVRIGNDFGEVELRPFYAGPAPGIPGVDQINVTLPVEGFAEGCLQRVAVSVDNSGVSSTTIAIASGDGPCVHPWGLSEAQLRLLDEGGQVKAATLNLIDTEFPPINGLLGRNLVAAQASMVLVSADGLESMTVQASSPFANALFSCGAGGGVVGSFAGGSISPLPLPPRPERNPIDPADAGEALDLIGPSGETLALVRPPSPDPRFPSMAYAPQQALEPGLFAPGDWTLRVRGGVDIEAFEARVRVPPIPQITPPVRLQRDEDVVVSWDGSRYEAGDTVRVWVSVPYRDEEGNQRVDSSTCFAQATLGGFRIAKQNIARLRAPDDGMADFGISVESASEFQTPAVVHGRSSFSARRSTRIPFE